MPAPALTLADAPRPPARPTLAPGEPVALRWSATALLAWTAHALVQGALWSTTFELPPGSWRYVLPTVLASGWLWFAVAPGIAWLATRVTPARRGLAPTLLVHGAAMLAMVGASIGVRVGGSLLFGAVHIPYWRSLAYWLDLHVVTYVAIAVIAHALAHHQRWLRRDRHALVLERQCSRARLHYLQRQLQPHFVFNALNAVAELTREAPESAARTLRRLAQLLRAAVACEATPELTLREELALMDAYLDVERVRFGDALHVERDVQADAMAALVPALLLQPLVENAVRHGVAVRGRGGHVAIRGRVAGGQLVLRVENDAAAAPSRGPAGRGGLGLRNTRERLQELYGGEARLELREEPPVGTVAEVVLPFREAAAVPLAAAAADEWAPSELAPSEPAPPAEPTAEPTATRTVAGLTPHGWLVVAGAWTAMTALWVAQGALQAAIDDEPVRLLHLLRISATSAACAILATPVIVWLARRVRLQSARWPWSLLVHAAAAAGFAVLQLRILNAIWSPGATVLASANVAQLSLNLFAYAAVVAWTQGRGFAARARERALAGARFQAEAARAAWHARTRTLQPDLLLDLLEHVARLAPAEPERAEQLVEELCDRLRELLAAPAGVDVGDVRAALAALLPPRPGAPCLYV